MDFPQRIALALGIIVTASLVIWILRAIRQAEQQTPERIRLVLKVLNEATEELRGIEVAERVVKEMPTSSYAAVFFHLRELEKERHASGCLRIKNLLNPPQDLSLHLAVLRLRYLKRELERLRSIKSKTPPPPSDVLMEEVDIKILKHIPRAYRYYSITSTGRAYLSGLSLDRKRPAQ